MEVLDPGFGLVQIWLLQPFEECTSGWRIALCLSLYHFAFKINKYFKNNNTVDAGSNEEKRDKQFDFIHFLLYNKHLLYIQIIL